MKKRQKNKSKNFAYFLRIIVALLLIGFASYHIYHIFLNYHNGNEEYRHAKQEYTVEIPEKGFMPDWDALLSQNPETVGWVRFENDLENISYPIVKGGDNSYYLHNTFEGSYYYAGAIFMDCHNAADFSDKNTIIYGHHLINGTMFSGLLKYSDYSYWESNPYFYLYTPDKKEHKMKIWSAMRTYGGEYVYTYAFGSTELQQEYINHIASDRYYDTGTIPTVSNNIVTLSTCTSDGTGQRFIVQGVEVETKQQ